MLKSHSSLPDMSALPVPQPPMSRSLKASDPRCSNWVDRAVSQKESHLVRAILMRRQPSVEVYGEMMSPDGSERVGSLIQTCNYDLRFVEVRTADATFSSVSLALDDVRCH